MLRQPPLGIWRGPRILRVEILRVADLALALLLRFHRRGRRRILSLPHLVALAGRGHRSIFGFPAPRADLGDSGFFELLCVQVVVGGHLQPFGVLFRLLHVGAGQRLNEAAKRLNVATVDLFEVKLVNFRGEGLVLELLRQARRNLENRSQRFLVCCGIFAGPIIHGLVDTSDGLLRALLLLVKRSYGLQRPWLRAKFDRKLRQSLNRLDRLVLLRIELRQAQQHFLVAWVFREVVLECLLAKLVFFLCLRDGSLHDRHPRMLGAPLAEPLKLAFGFVEFARLQQQEALVDADLDGLFQRQLVLQRFLGGDVDALQRVEQ
mmetsp:Transcript_53609/g.149139  ORF Transcript_53609/g.149139 Transcript_53609/m.149139 type:complete len:320 (+) Transcript_53609:314-1273(+)